MTAAHVQDFVKTLAVGHECPLFSHQHSCRLVSHPQFTGIQIKNTAADFQNASETSSFLAAPTPDSLEATPTRRDLLCPAIASPVSVRLEPTFVLCRTSGLFCQLASLSLHRHGHHKAQETRNQQTVGPLYLSRPAAQELPPRVSKSHPVSREIRSVRPPNSSHVDKSSLCPHVSDLGQICMSGLACRQLIKLVHEELFSTLPQHRSLLLVHCLQVALDFAVVFL